MYPAQRIPQSQLANPLKAEHQTIQKTAHCIAMACTTQSSFCSVCSTLLNEQCAMNTV